MYNWGKNNSVWFDGINWQSEKILSIIANNFNKYTVNITNLISSNKLINTAKNCLLCNTRTDSSCINFWKNPIMK